MTKLNSKDALVRVPLDSIMTTSFKNKAKVYNAIHSLVSVSNKIIKVSFDYVLKIVKREIHGTLKGFSNIFKDEGIFRYAKVPQGKIYFVLC